MTAEILLIRHAHTDPDNALFARDGRWDPPLSALGREQAQTLAERLATCPPTKLISSPLRRARQTAAATAAGCGGLAVHEDQRWLEFHRGDEENYPASSPAAVPSIDSWQGGEWESWPNGETRAEFRARLAAAFDDVLATPPPYRIAIFTHCGTMNEILNAVLCCAPFALFQIDNTGIVRLVTSGARIPKVWAVNDLWHLDDPLRYPAGAGAATALISA
jgi:broad specificity phosphatase PhoE